MPVTNLTFGSAQASVDHLYPAKNNTQPKGLLNPNPLGEVLVSIYYNTRIQTLEIKVREARNLVPMESRSSMMLNNLIRSAQASTSDGQPGRPQCNPYVKTYLLPDKSSTSKRKTRAKMDTENPVFNDLLSYIVDGKEVLCRTLWITIWHAEKYAANQVRSSY